MPGERIQAFGSHPFGKTRSLWKNIGFSGLLAAVVSMICQQGVAEPRRVAVVPANGPFAKASVAVAMGENRVAEAVASKLAEKPGILIIDRAHVDELIKEQNFQNMDRSSSDTAAKIGKLVGAGQIVMVELVSATQSNRQERTATSLKTIGTVTAEVTARAIDVESGVVLAQPTSRFEDSAVVTEMKTWPVPKTVGDPQVAFSNLWTKCTDTVAAEMADKLADALSHAPGPKAELPLVAGISNGSVFINQGSSSGIKKGDRFQVTRLVSTGLVDPKTQQEIKQKQQICTFVVVNADEGNSSGTCDGGTPKSGDVAEPLKP